MPDYTIGGKVAVKAVADILAERKAALERTERHGKRAAGRQREIDRLAGQLRQLGAMLKGKFATVVEPAIVGLLCAWATGNLESLSILEDYLRDAGDPRVKSVEKLQGDDIAAAVRLLALAAANEP
jgi:hypothetical protein